MPATGLNILLIEDNTSDRYLIKEMLDESLLKVNTFIEADLLKAGISFLQKEKFDVVLLDLTLPDRSGIDTFKNILPFAGNTPVIILSGIRDMSIALEAISLGAQDYHLKDDLNQKMLTKAILYSIERGRTLGEVKENSERFLSISKSELALVQREEKYRTLIEQASDAIIMYSLDSRIVDYNNAFMLFMGYEKEDIANLRLHDLLFEEDLKNRPLVIDKILEGKAVHDVRRARRKDGSAVKVELNSKLMPDGNVMVIARDITEREKVMEALKNSEEKYRTLVEQAVDAIGLYDASGIIMDVNTGSANLLGYTKEELIGMSLAQILTVEELDKNPIRFDYLEAGHSTVKQRKMKRKDGSIVETEVRSQQLPDGRYLSVIRDLTERIKVEKQLEESYEAIRRLTSYIQDIREEERINIAKEIHDDLGQKLTVLKMDISWLKNKLKGNEEPVRQKVDELITMLDETVASVRKISLELRPSLLDDLGLVPAMEWQLEEFEKEFGIQTRFIHSGDELQLPGPLKTSLFRIFQDSLTNVGRHSLANEVTISIRKEENNLVLAIDDDGKGFDKEIVADKKTLGILGMQERINRMGGEYKINSQPGKGTEVIVQIQLK